MYEDIEENYVLKFYKDNADAFTRKRTSPWMPVRSFLSENWVLGMITLDYGCGNGRNIPREGIGIDVTRELFNNCPTDKSLVHCDGISLPFQDNSFDLILNIAVIQHFSTSERRIQGLKECFRVLKNGGKSLITGTSFSYKMRKKHKSINENDILVYSKRINESLRYHHLFSEEELIGLVKEVGFIVLKSGIFENNVFVEVEKNKNVN